MGISHNTTIWSNVKKTRLLTLELYSKRPWLGLSPCQSQCASTCNSIIILLNLVFSYTFICRRTVCKQTVVHTRPCFLTTTQNN